MIKLTLSILLSTALCSTVQAKEKDVVINVNEQKVIGTLEVPDGVTKPAVVLMLHGFTGSRNELPVSNTKEGIYQRIARVMADNQIATLRIDFRGSGESDGLWSDTTFSGQIADANAAINWLKKQKQFDSSRIGLLGWSQGGLVASHAAAQNSETIKSLALLAPVSTPFSTYSLLLGNNLVHTAAFAEDKNLTYKATLPWGAETELKGAFFQEFLTVSPLGAIGSYSKPMLVISGKNDTVVRTVKPYIDYHEGEEQHIELETDHAWSAFSGPEVLDKNVIPNLVSWFNKM